MKYVKPVAATATALSMLAQPVLANGEVEPTMEEKLIVEAAATSSSDGGIMVPLLFLLLVAATVSGGSSSCVECL